MSLIDLNMIGILLEELNREIAYKITEKSGAPLEKAPKLLTIHSEGTDHRIKFAGITIWDSEKEKKYEDLKPEEELNLNTKENFETFLRNAINGELETLSQLEM